MGGSLPPAVLAFCFFLSLSLVAFGDVITPSRTCLPLAGQTTGTNNTCVVKTILSRQVGELELGCRAVGGKPCLFGGACSSTGQCVCTGMRTGSKCEFLNLCNADFTCAAGGACENFFALDAIDRQGYSPPFDTGSKCTCDSGGFGPTCAEQTAEQGIAREFLERHAFFFSNAAPFPRSTPLCSMNNNTTPLPPGSATTPFQVTCDTQGNIASIVASSFMMTEEGLPSWINLASLRVLSISNGVNVHGVSSDSTTLDTFMDSQNQVLGFFPPALTTLNLTRIGLVGAIPAALVAAPQASLQVLDLSHNRLSGAIPDLLFDQYLFPSLRVLDLSHNEFSGVLPPSMCTFLLARATNTSLPLTLRLNNNNLSGFIGSCAGLNATQVFCGSNIFVDLAENKDLVSFANSLTLPNNTCASLTSNSSMLANMVNTVSPCNISSSVGNTGPVLAKNTLIQSSTTPGAFLVFRQRFSACMYSKTNATTCPATQQIYYDPESTRPDKTACVINFDLCFQNGGSVDPVSLACVCSDGSRCGDVCQLNWGQCRDASDVQSLAGNITAWSLLGVATIAALGAGIVLRPGSGKATKKGRRPELEEIHQD